jgi:short subunit dehydrogenase-like uncharacterized protein
VRLLAAPKTKNRHPPPSPPQDVPILVASLDDPASLDAAIGSAAVVLTTAGPYTELGTPLLEAAVRNGTHYADLTAESESWERAERGRERVRER